MITKDFGTQVEKCLDKAMGDYEPRSCKVACYFHRKNKINLPAIGKRVQNSPSATPKPF